MNFFSRKLVVALFAFVFCLIVNFSAKTVWDSQDGVELLAVAWASDDDDEDSEHDDSDHDDSDHDDSDHDDSDHDDSDHDDSDHD
nr:hypothetical protein [Desulfobulbaceae bacterium]